MNSELIMKSDVLDILFEKRNKAYGAYTLRKFYNKRLLASIGIMIVVVTAFSAFTFLPENPRPVFIITDPGFGTILPPSKVPEVKPPLVRPIVTPPASTLKLRSTFIFVDKEDSSDILHELTDKMQIGNTTNIFINDTSSHLIVPSATGNGEVVAPANPAETSVDILTPIENPEIMPAYPGGMEALRKFLIRNLNNPRDLEAGELISVKVTFVVGYDGKLKHFELKEDGGREFNSEVIRVLKKMPIWIPGKSKGQNVSVYYTIPVKFIPED